jgi:hypothetical protein
VPIPSGLETLQRPAQPGPVAELPSLQLPVLEFLDERAPMQLGTAAAGLAAYLAMGWAVGFLGVAARARRPASKFFEVYLPVAGGVLLGVYAVVFQIARVMLVDDLLSGARTVEAVAAADSALLQFGDILRLLGAVAMGTALVAVGLNAMRTGLMTRLFGYLGIVTGALMLMQVFFEVAFEPGATAPSPDPMPIVGIFWLAGLAALLFGRWPGGEPPAWRTGVAEPWPVPGRPAAPDAPEPQPAAAPTAARRKRKKKRH